MIVTFSGVYPPERHPPVVGSWTEVEIEEAPFSEGPWTVLPTRITLDPLDADPTEPQPREFSTNEATLDSGWYRLKFYDAGGNFSDYSDPVLNAPSYALPTVRQIADKLTARTRIKGGALAYTFDDRTEPKGERVERLIGQAYDVVYGKVGVLTDISLIRDATELIRLYTAMSIELAHFAEQVRAGQSPYPEFKELYDAGIAALVEAVGGEGGSAVDDVGVLTANTPHYDFPETAIGDGIMP